MKWILLLAIIPIIQYGEVAGYAGLKRIRFRNRTPIKHTPIKHTSAGKNKSKSPESNCKYCHLNDIIRTAYEAIREIPPIREKDDMPQIGYLGTLYGESFQDILMPRSARSPRVELTRYLSNSFNDSLARIKEKLDVLERHYKLINEISQKAEANKEKEQQTDQILLTEESSKYEFYFNLLSNPLMAKSILYHWTKEFDDDIDYIKNNLGLLKTDYERVIDNLKKIEATRKKEQQTGHMFVHHGLFIDEPIEDMIQSRSTRSPYLTNSFNDAFAFIRIMLDSLEIRYEHINGLLQKAKTNKEKGEQTDQIRPLSEESYFVRTPWTVELSTLPHFKKWFDNDMADIKGNLELLKNNYKLVIDNLKEIINVGEANSQEDKKDPSPSESIVSNNNTEENVTQTIPTPDISTNTQKPVPTKHDDKKDKLVGEKNPLHTPEIAPNNKTSENVIIPIESTIIENLELTSIKNEGKPELVEQEAKIIPYILIQNGNNEKVAPSSFTVDKIVFNSNVPFTWEELKRILDIWKMLKKHEKLNLQSQIDLKN